MNGVLVLDKPAGFTSFDAVAVLRKLSGERKIGHTGTLDPQATGVLPVLLGRAAKALELLPDTDKAYRAEFRLGERTDTGDATGKVVETGGRRLCREALEAEMPRFVGEIDQVPPMTSAVSVGGQRLYRLARQGLEVDRPARRVRIDGLVLTDFDEETQSGVLEVRCSKGTYIRTLVEDLARAAGSLGTLTALRRTAACGFTLADAVPLETVREAAAAGRFSGLVRPTESLFAGLTRVTVTAAQAYRFQNGGSLDRKRLHLETEPAPGARLRVCGPDGTFLGLGEAREDDIRFLKLFCEGEP